MPILSIFIVGLVFKNIDARAGIGAVIFGVMLYASLTFEFSPFYSSWHYIHLMPVTLAACITFALVSNRFVFGNTIQFAKGDEIETA
jgi:SSS family solute:Na+ symporter